MIKFEFWDVRVLYLQHTPKIAHTAPPQAVYISQATVYISQATVYIKSYRAKYDSYYLAPQRLLEMPYDR